MRTVWGCVVIGLIAAGSACKSESTGSAEPSGPRDGWRVQVGEQAPDFMLVTTEAEKVRLSDFKGKVVVANFFATWCGPCRVEVDAFHKELLPRIKDDQRVALLTIAWQEMRSTVADYIRAHEYDWPFLLDVEGTAFEKYAYGGIPRLMILDHEGKIASLHVGFGNDSMKTLFAELTPLLSRVPATDSDAAPISQGAMPKQSAGMLTRAN